MTVYNSLKSGTHCTASRQPKGWRMPFAGSSICVNLFQMAQFVFVPSRQHRWSLFLLALLGSLPAWEWLWAVLTAYICLRRKALASNQVSFRDFLKLFLVTFCLKKPLCRMEHFIFLQTSCLSISCCFNFLFISYVLRSFPARWKETATQQG